MLKISHGTRIKNINDTNGYGYATVNMIDSLTRLGYEVNQNDATADVEIWFDQPHHWKFSPNTYKVGFHPWESTALLPPSKRTNFLDWKDVMNQCDEVWTPSPLIAQWYTERMGVTAPVFVYEHGVDPAWKKEPRQVFDKMKFLHVGAEASRKGGIETMKAFRAAFPKNNDVELTMKIMSKGWKIPQLNRVNIINEKYSLPDLIGLFHSHHAYVYPSWGEGFGLTPLQAMATGMPTITVPEWAPYRDLLNPRLSLSAGLHKTQWPQIHPGLMLKPNFDDIVDAFRYTYEHYDEVHTAAQAAVPKILERYDWLELTRTAFESLSMRMGKSSKIVALETSA